MVKKIAAKDSFSNFVAMKIAGLKITKNTKIPEILVFSTRFFYQLSLVISEIMQFSNVHFFKI